MLSIDEAIEELKSENGYYANNRMTDVAEFNTKIIRWLEELKAIKDGSIPIIHGKAELELHDKAIRNEAIDDFIHECDKHCEFYSGKNISLTREDILKIAEQLKE